MDFVTISGCPVAPLGLAAHPETSGECVAIAAEGGVNAFFFYDRNAQALLDGLAAHAGRADGRGGQSRDGLFLMTGTESRDVEGARADLDASRARLDCDVLDLFLLLYVAPADDPGAVDAQLDELARWRDAGLVRHVGVSAHSRPLAARYAADARTDAVMHRYNMAHRGAEESVLPAAAAAATPVVAFTCTRWGTLLEGHAEWDGPAPSAADCYRFALARPEIRLALTAPHTADELRENLSVLSSPALGPDALDLWRRYGDLVHGDGATAFETQWP